VVRSLGQRIEGPSKVTLDFLIPPSREGDRAGGLRAIEAHFAATDAHRQPVSTGAASFASESLQLVVRRLHAWRKALVDGDEVSVCIGKRDGDRHLAAQRGVLRLELVHLDDLLVRNEPHEATVVRVGLRRRLAGPGWRVVRERDPERAIFAGRELVDEAGHAGRHFPPRDYKGIEKCTIDGCAGRLDVWQLMRVELTTEP
jgi:hypothetical protein